MTDPRDMVNVRYMVDDVQEAVDFYTKFLGFEVLRSFPPFADVVRGGLRLLLFTLLPAGFVAYLPARVARGAGLSDLACMLGAALGYLLLARSVFRAGLRRYSSGSRFGVFG